MSGKPRDQRRGVRSALEADEQELGRRPRPAARRRRHARNRLEHARTARPTATGGSAGNWPAPSSATSATTRGGSPMARFRAVYPRKWGAGRNPRKAAFGWRKSPWRWCIISAARRVPIPSFIHESGEPGMRKLCVASFVVALGWLAVSLTSTAQEDKKVTIKEVMKTAMKGGLCDEGRQGRSQRRREEAARRAVRRPWPPTSRRRATRRVGRKRRTALVDCGERGRRRQGRRRRQAAGRRELHGLPHGPQGQVSSPTERPDISVATRCTSCSGPRSFAPASPRNPRRRSPAMDRRSFLESSPLPPACCLAFVRGTGPRTVRRTTRSRSA